MSVLVFVLVVLASAVTWWAWENSRRRTHPVPRGLRKELELPHERDFELYHNALSLCSMKSRLCMAELGIAYKSHHIDLIETGAYENIRRDFLAVNPSGTVPVLLHRGHPVYESHEQIRYAAQHAPPGSPGLVPKEPALRAAMEHWIDRSSLGDDPIAHGDVSAGNAVPGLTLPLFATMVGQIPYWKILEGLLFHFDKKRPFLFLALKWLGIARIERAGPAPRILARSRQQMGAHLDALEKQLGETHGPWILGDGFSLADVSWLVIFERLRQADCVHVFMGEGRRPECAGYWARLQSRPGYREAILDHSHPTIDHGTRRLQEVKSADPALRAVLEGA